MMVSAAAAGLCVSMSAQADITNGFSGFSAVNSSGVTGTSVGYSLTGSTFTLTNAAANETVTGFDPTPQDISSFDATFTYQQSSASSNTVGTGAGFVIMQAGNGVTALGGGGTGLGYSGIGNSAALLININNSSGTAAANNGTIPGYTITGLGTGNTSKPIFNTGDKIQVTVEYFNSTLTANYVDLTTGSAVNPLIVSNYNISSYVGSTTALVGFSGATGSARFSTQNVSNFTFVSGNSPAGPRIYAPIAINGYNEQGIISIAKGQSAVTATMDGGILKSGDTWYEQGWNTFNTSSGIPKSGSLFTSTEDKSHTFQMANYSSNDVVMVTSVAGNGPTTATMNLSTPSAYSALSFLTASGNGPSSFKVTVNYADNAPSTTGLSVISPDWFSGTPSAWTSDGRDTLTSSSSAQPDNYGQTPKAPNLYEEDLILPDSTDPISSVTVTAATGGQIMIFALSGVTANTAPQLTYTGAAIPGKFDNSTLNFTQSVNGSTGATNFLNGDQVIFDDTASDTVHNITVSNVSGGILSGGLIFNNTTATNPYTFSGYGIGGPGGISVNGGGTVILDNPNTFSGAAVISNGVLDIGPGGNLASSNIAVYAGSTLNVSGGTLSASNSTGINLSDSGTVSDSGTSLTLSALNGTGPLSFTNSSNTSLTITGGGTYSGSITQTGTLSLTINSTNASTGAVIMTGSNTYTGTTTLKAGAFEIGTNTVPNSSTINLSGGALGAFAPQVNLPNTIIGGPLILPSGTNVIELSGTANTFTGPVVIQSGATLQLDSPGSIGGLNGANSATGTITVASGAILLVNDNSGTLGLTGGVVGGAPINTVLSGTGAGNGALLGPDNQSVTWAGNINVSGPAQMSPGFSGTLTLSGAITGNGPVIFAPNSNANSSLSTLVLSPPTATSTNYTGETQIVGGTNTLVGFTIQMTNSNGFSPVSGLNFNGGTGPVTVDLNGNNQAVTYLTGSGPSGSSLTNSSGNPSTFTITSGLKNGVASTFSTPITGNR
jgi:autotransporter-associated beta strand protein